MEPGFVKQHQSLFSLTHQALDVVIVWMSFALSVWALNLSWSAEYDVAVFLGSLIFLVLARQNRIYNSWRGQSISQELRQLAKTWLGMLLVLLFMAFVFKASSIYSRKAILTWLVLAPTLLAGYRVILRLFLRYIRASGRNVKRAVIVGAGPLGVSLAQNILSSPSMGITLEGFYDDKEPLGSYPLEGVDLPIIGNLDKLVFDACMGAHEDIYLALPMRAEKQVKALVKTLSDSSAQVHYVPDIFTFNLINSRLKDMGGMPVISVYDSPLDGFGRLAKRTEDIVLGSLILLLVSLPMALIAFLVKCSSKGPVLFKQRRYGLSGEPIEVWKFRTMYVCENGKDICQARKNDDRITAIGAFLRKTSLDELPQFVNVLQGSMSIVGPRPHAVAHNEQYRREIEGYMQRHLVKPGITGWAQINGWRGETDTLEKMEKRVEHDLHYVRNWSLWFDIKIILLTIVKGFVNKNAY